MQPFMYVCMFAKIVKILPLMDGLYLEKQETAQQRKNVQYCVILVEIAFACLLMVTFSLQVSLDRKMVTDWAFIMFSVTTLMLSVALSCLLCKLNNHIKENQVFDGMLCDKKMIIWHNFCFFTASIFNVSAGVCLELKDNK